MTDIHVTHNPTLKPCLGALTLLALLSCGTPEPEPRPDPPPAPPTPEFEAITNIAERKRLFFAFLEPHVQAVNQEIDEHRRLVESTLRQATPSSPHRSLQRLAERYRVELSVSPTPELTELYTRADVVPLSLALAQAAHESAWGTSRFAVEGRNYFGIWCYQPGCGITPLERTPGATHEVHRFESVTDSVRRYAHLLNTHPAYK